jgi:large subunit ribosomal protein L24
MAHVRKGDTVVVTTGRDRGKSGKVLQVWPAEGRALIERINMVKHFERRTQQNQAGGVAEREGPMALANVALLCPRCRKGVRAAHVTAADGTKERVCRRCREALRHG